MKIVLLGLKRIVVPRSVVVPTTESGPSGSPILFVAMEPAVARDVSVSEPESALTTRRRRRAGRLRPCRVVVEFPAGMQHGHDDSAAERFSSA